MTSTSHRIARRCFATFAPTPCAALVLACTSPGAGEDEDEAEPYAYEDRISALAPMEEPRFGVTATSLADGRVLIVGGILGPPSMLDLDAYVGEVEIWDPVDETLTRGASLAQPRNQHSATLLDDGRVVILGGNTVNEQGLTGPALPVEVWDPQSESVSTVGELPAAMVFHCTTALPDGTALAIDDCDPEACSPVRVDPQGGLTELGGTPSYSYAIDVDCATLPDGRVLLVGGEDAGAPVAEAEIYDPASESFTTVGPMTTSFGRDSKLAPLAEDGGEFLIVGGSPAGEVVGQIYSAAENSFRAVPGEVINRSDHSLTPLADGRVLIAGGRAEIDGNIEFIAGLDIYDPETDTLEALGLDIPGRWGHGAARAADGPILIVGGQDGSGHLADVQLYR